MFRQLRHAAAGLLALAALGWAASLPVFHERIYGSRAEEVAFAASAAMLAVFVVASLSAAFRARKAKAAPAKHAWPYRSTGKR